MDNNINNNVSEPAYEAPQTPAYEAPAYTAAPAAPAEDNSTKALVFGILGLAFSWTGILGLIFSILGKKQAKQYVQGFGQLTGKAKVGSILSTVGLIISIIMLVVWAIYIIAAIVLAASVASAGYYYY